MTTALDRPGLGVPLSEAIRRATTAAHTDAQTAPFVSALVRGTLPVAGYARLVAQHRAIYEALERPMDELRADPDAGPFVDDGLVRLGALEADLVALLGEGWSSRPEAELLPATVEYCSRIQDVAVTWGAGWVAHHYVRYLGDLSGGLFLRRRIEAAYGIDETSGTAFYDFPAIPDPAAWKDTYRRRLDAAPWDLDERGRVTAEVLEGYRFNTELFEQLSA